MKSVVFIFSLLCIVLFLLAEVVSQVTGTDPCMGYSGCTTSCFEGDLQHCRDPQRYIQGVCKKITGGCICQPGLVGATCNNTCGPGKYGIACTNPCNCDVKECNRATGCPSSDYTMTIFMIIVSTVIVIVGVISLFLIVRKYRLNKSITKHLERAQDNSEAQLLSDGTRTRSGNDYEGIDTRFENTENMQVDSTHEQVLNSSDYVDMNMENDNPSTEPNNQPITIDNYTEIRDADLHQAEKENTENMQVDSTHEQVLKSYDYVDMNMENDNPSTEPNNQPITIDNYTEIRDADLHQAEEENVQVQSSSEQIASSYSYIDINLEKEPQHVRKNDQTIDNYMEIRDEDLNQAEEFSLTPSYMSPNDITEIPAFFKSDNACTVESALRKITIGISDVPKIMNKQDEVYNILNRIPKQVKHFDTNYDHVTPNDDLYNDLNFTLK